MTQTTDGYAGQRGLTDDKSQFNVLAYIVESLLSDVRTCIPVKIVAVSNDGGVEPVGTVDVQPLINQIDGVGNPTPHGIILSLAYFRLQGGSNAVIMDPQVDDIGFAVISDRDMSVVKSTKAQGNPGSYRRFDLCDGIYIGGILNGTPTQYVRFTADGITLADANGHKIEMTSVGTTITGNLFVTGEVTGLSGSPATKVTLSQHIHSANNTPPTPGH